MINSDKLIAIWNNLPEFVRWIICWPLIISAAVLGWAICNIFMWLTDLLAFGGGGFSFTEQHTANNIATLINVCISTGVTFLCLNGAVLFLVPRGQDIVAAFAAFIIGVVAFSAVFDAFFDDGLSTFQKIGAMIECSATGLTAIVGAALVRHNIMKGRRELAWFDE